MPTLDHDKRTTVETALEDGIVMLHIDARRDGVEVPGNLMGDPQLILSIAWGFRLPALDIDDNGIYAVLRFGTVDFGCTVPWAALYAITQPEHEGRGALWPASMPPEALAASPELRHVPRVTLGPPPEPDSEPDQPRRPIRLVRPDSGYTEEPGADPPGSRLASGASRTSGKFPARSEGPADAEAADTPGDAEAADTPAETSEPVDPPPDSPPRRSHLRLVKG